MEAHVLTKQVVTTVTVWSGSEPVTPVRMVLSVPTMSTATPAPAQPDSPELGEQIIPQILCYVFK